MSRTIQGIDVSVHQGLIDWSKVKASGKEFVFVRLGWCGYDGKIVDNGGLDKNYHANMRGAAAAGLSVGVYVYSYANTVLAARVAAQETLELVKPYVLTYPVAFDIEDQQYTHMTKAENTAITNAFLQRIEQARYYGILYTYKYFAEGNLNMSDLAAYDMWIAQYASSCTYKGDYGIWQYAGEKGTCGGVKTACDLNIAYKDYAGIIAAAGLNAPGIDKSTALEEAQDRIRELEEAIAKIKAFVGQL